MKTIFRYKEFQDNLVSVVVPVLNELENVKILNKFLKIALASKDMEYEVIYIDDYSTDGTYEYLLEQQAKLQMANKGLSRQQNIFVYRKKGRKGKSFSLIEGFSHAKGGILVMIDADLQYPVTAIPEMIKKLDKSDIVVANRKKIKTSFLRKAASITFRNIFGNFLFGLKTDVQSGLKVFKRQVYESVKFLPKTPWTFDLEFLYRSSEAGFKIKNHDITFSKRQNGQSKVLFLRQVFEIGINALRVKLIKLNPVLIMPESSRSMLGAGIGYKKKLFITHTTLPYQKTAFKTFVSLQVLIIGVITGSFVLGTAFIPLITFQIVVSVISIIYFIDVIFNLFIILRSLTKNREISFSDKEISGLETGSLPVYSILCPLYKEGRVLPQFIDAIKKIDWPKDKLDVLLLLEEDDKETFKIAKSMDLPPYVRIAVVPYSEPKTKPKACNYGLNIANGELIVIYDAEDVPETDQLKKAYLGFKKSDQNTVCLQAKLSYYNPKQNLLTRFFASEYLLWFDLTLPGFQSLQTSLPLGGTSNHFKTDILRKLHGWDTFNVTEDADLGIRLFKHGYKTAIIESTTYEEANSNLHNWLRQRSRWIKGYLQSYFVHTRDIIQFARQNKIHALLLQLIIGTKLTFIFLNPVLWAVTLSYFLLFTYVGPVIEAVYRTPAFYLGVVSLIFGNFLFFYYYLIGNAKKNQWDLMRSSIFIPIYWLLISIAGWIAVYQLILKPHYWEKTVHGLHLNLDKKKKKTEETVIEIGIPVVKKKKKLPGYGILSNWKLSTPKFYSGSLLISAMICAHLLNFIFNIYLYRETRIPLDSLNIISLITSFFYLISIPVNAFELVSIHKSADNISRQSEAYAYFIYKKIRKNITKVSLAALLLWFLISPVVKEVINTESIYPVLLFAPVVFIAFLFAYDRGYISGNLKFSKLAVLIILEPLLKLVLTAIFINSGFPDIVYSSLIYSFILTFIVGSIILPKYKADLAELKLKAEDVAFPSRFFVVSLATGLSGIAFLSLDILLANHYLSSANASVYAVISMVGKMIYFLGSLSTQFIVPLVSRLKNDKTHSQTIFKYTLSTSMILTFSGLVLFGLMAKITLPFLLGIRSELVLPYIFMFSIGIGCFTVSRVFVNYYLAKDSYSYPIASGMLAVFQIIIISFRHNSVDDFILGMTITGMSHLAFMLILHINNNLVIKFEKGTSNFKNLFSKRKSYRKNDTRKPAVLIFNWRDIKHMWAGGAEVYIHEIAKRWVREGLAVTVFTSSDANSKLDETIDGVKIIRRGGTYTVYVWAVIYYLFVLNNKYDVILDCENGIPFFTPLYSNKPKFLLVHHVHQKVFNQYLPWPMAKLAAILEAKLMPFVYKNVQVITVSESSKNELIKLGSFKSENIQIVYNGINSSSYNLKLKTDHPSFIYLGRLKPHKNIDIGIKAFAKVLDRYPNAVLNIVGDGEEKLFLKDLAKSLHIENNVKFHGKVSDEAKFRLLGESWAMIHPSSLEGWGITVIEANGSGTPVIASDVNGLKDSVVNNETGLLVEARNVKQFALAMEYLLANNTELERYTRNSIAWSKKFTWDKSAESFYILVIENLTRKEFRGVGVAVGK